METGASERRFGKMGTQRLITRRELLRWLGMATAGRGALRPLGIFAQAPPLVHSLHGRDSATGFFTREQQKTVAILCDLIIPADSVSPGAREAGVPDFIERLLKVSDSATQKIWSKGLEGLKGFAMERFGSSFASLEPARQESLLSALAENEFQPHTALERFFVEAKRLIAMGYYTSEVGLLKDLKYQGNSYLAESPRCTQHAR